MTQTSIRKTISHRKMKKSKPQPEQSKIEESQNSEFVQYCDIHRFVKSSINYLHYCEIRNLLITAFFQSATK